MSAYRLARWIYRWGDRLVFRHLPGTGLNGWFFRLARRLFPARIQARSPTELAGSVRRTNPACRQLPAWAVAEVALLAEIEPALRCLLDDPGSVEPHCLPWDIGKVGQRYARARRQLRDHYACIVLAGGPGQLDAERLRSAKRPLAVIDLDGHTGTRQAAGMAEADYLVLPADGLDADERIAVMLRLVLQLAPQQVWHAQHPLIDQCVQRHGLAMRSTSSVEPWPGSTPF